MRNRPACRSRQARAKSSNSSVAPRTFATRAANSSPHPDLAATFAAIAPSETAAERLKRFGTLAKLQPEHPETKMLLAELNIAAEDFPAARRAIGDLATENPTARALTIMAAVERGEGSDDAIVRGWLTRALTAPRGPQWICDNCQSIHGTWAPVCSNCDAFDTLAWRAPSEAEVAVPSSTEMLPLIVGAPEPTIVEDDIGTAEELLDGEVLDDAGPEKT